MIPKHWIDVSTEDNPESAYLRNDGRCRIEKNAVGRWAAAIPHLIFQREQDDDDSLEDFMSKVDDLDTPRIPVDTDAIVQPPREMLSSMQVACTKTECKWRRSCVCALAATDRTMVPDLQAVLCTPKQPEVLVGCASFKKEDD